MLKFTKYRKASTGSFALNALQNSEDVPSGESVELLNEKFPSEVKLSSFRKICNDGNEVDCSGHAQAKQNIRIPQGIKNSLVSTGKILSDRSSDPGLVDTNLSQERPLSFSKVPREELVLLNSNLEKDSEDGTGSVKKIKRVHFSESTLFDDDDSYERKEKKQSKISFKTRTTFNPSGRVRVPVYNDDYFPKVQSINVSCFRMRKGNADS